MILCDHCIVIIADKKLKIWHNGSQMISFLLKMTMSSMNSDPIFWQRWEDWSVVPHGFFGRSGGVSHAPYASLNGALKGTNDSNQNVMQNRQLALKTLGLITAHPILPCQEHTSVVHTVRGVDDDPVGAVDALVTDSAYVALGILTADCAPVLFWDHQSNIIGAAHAGWKGALAGILENTVQAMKQLGAYPQSIQALIGPTIRSVNYPVSDLWVEQNCHHPQLVEHVVYFHEKPHFDLPSFVASRLRPLVSHVVDLGCDTYGTTYFSRRYAMQTRDSSSSFDDHIQFGRNMSWIALPHATR